MMRSILNPSKALILCAAAASVSLPQISEARRTKSLSYPYRTIWSAAMRLIRVDERWTIQDKDKDTGYILFIYPGSGSIKRCPASLEIIRRGAQPDEGGDQPGSESKRRVQPITVQLAIAHQPSYIELALLDKLEAKMVAEYGAPRPPQAPSRSPKHKSPKQKSPEHGSPGSDDSTTRD